jgi:hypothetical protein
MTAPRTTPPSTAAPTSPCACAAIGAAEKVAHAATTANDFFILASLSDAAAQEEHPSASATGYRADVTKMRPPGNKM